MGLHILEERMNDVGGCRAVFYCSTSDWAFGPLMPSIEVAEAFLAWMDKRAIRPRILHDHELNELWHEFQAEHIDESATH